MQFVNRKLDITTVRGIRIYRNTLLLVLLKVLHDLFPDKKTIIEYTINKGCYATVEGVDMNNAHIDTIKNGVQKYIDADMPIKEILCKKDQAIEILEKGGYIDSARSLHFIDKEPVLLYELDGFLSVFYSEVADSTGYVDLFDIREYESGFIFFYPTRHRPFELPEYTEQVKLASVFGEFNRWGEVLGIPDVVNLNRTVREGKINDIILASEALQDLKLGEITHAIAGTDIKFVMIAGPSSSGKTTFANRLRIHLIIHGINAKIISMDDYYINRKDMIPDEFGEVDLEAIDALDIEFFKQNIEELSKTGHTMTPVFDFTVAERKHDLVPLDLYDNEVLIIEGIHGLNPEITGEIKKDEIYKIYISALTTINIDNHNRFPTTDTRLIRRITRDYQYRNASPSHTFGMWPSVRAGEDKYIFPYQEQADVIFNSALAYEHGVLRKITEPILKQVGPDDVAYKEAQRLLDTLATFEPIEPHTIPPSSILREFIGGSCFDQT